MARPLAFMAPEFLEAWPLLINIPHQAGLHFLREWLTVQRYRLESCHGPIILIPP